MSEERDEDKGFRVTDRRVGAEEPSERDADDVDDEGATQQRAPRTSGPPADESAHAERADAHGDIPPIDFTTFILSLSTSCLVHLGDLGDPSGAGKEHVDLSLARQTIDLLGVLEEKTRGNLSGEEERLLHQMLYDLRMRYVAKKG